MTTNHNLRVLMVATRAYPYVGGVETHVYQVSRRLARAGVDVTVLSTDLVSLVGARDGLAAESRHMLHTLPAGVIRCIIRAVVRREPEGLACSAAILTGLAVTGLGYVKGMTTIASQLAGGPVRSGHVH